MAKKEEKVSKIIKKEEKIISKKEKTDPVFLPFGYKDHKENKVAAMKAELSVLKCLRILENLKRLQDEKARLRRELQHLFVLSRKDFEKTISEMPIITNTGEIKRVEQSTSVDFEGNYQEKFQSLASAGTNTTALGKELLDIQEKLKKLSNYQ